MQKIEGTTIKVNRGDELNISLTITQNDGTNYTFEDGDAITFAIYNKNALNERAVLLKEISATEGEETLLIHLTNEDTKIGELINKPVVYWYEINLNDEHTIIGYDDDGAKIFKLYPEGSMQQ